MRLLPALAVAAIIVASLPGAAVDRPFTAIGLDQDWRLFAPDPIDATLALRAEVEYDNGETASWRLPEGGPLAPQAGSRWRQWERAVATRGDPRLLAASARWIAREAAAAGRRPTHVTLAYRWRSVPPPGAVSAIAPRGRFDLYALTLGGGGRE